MYTMPQPQFIVFETAKKQWWWEIRDLANHNALIGKATAPCVTRDQCLTYVGRIMRAAEVVVLVDEREVDQG